MDKIFNLDKELNAVENELQTLVGEILTLALPSELITETEKKLSQEINTLKQQDQSAVIGSLKNKFNKQLIKNLSSEIQDKEKVIKEITNAIELTWDEIKSVSTTKTSLMSNYFSDEQIKTAFTHIQDIKATTNREIARLVGKQDALQKEKSELLSMQQLFDSGRFAQDILDKKSNTLGQISTKQHELERVEAEIMVLNQEMTNLKNTIERLESSLEISKDIQKELEEVESYQSLIKDFMNEARGRRANLLSKKTSDVIKTLAHKEDLISRVKIDEKTYSINLLDSKNNIVSRMSAGESEIFALSLLQALGEVSNRKLPVVIDTPLGRLDYSHRKSIVSNYFHNVSEQVFILSTDTEIDQSLYSELEPFINQTFLIKSNKDKTSSIFPDKYFEFSKATQ